MGQKEFICNQYMVEISHYKRVRLTTITSSTYNLIQTLESYHVSNTLFLLFSSVGDSFLNHYDHILFKIYEIVYNFW